MHQLIPIVVWGYLVVGVFVTSRVLDTWPTFRPGKFSFAKVFFTALLFTTGWPAYAAYRLTYQVITSVRSKFL